jgi:phosphoglycerate kinase
MKIKTIKQCRNLGGKHVLVRVDFNVPLKGKKVLDNTRLLASLSTIKYLIEKKSKVILITHVGRPAGKIVSSLKTDPIAEELSKLLKKKVTKLETGNFKLNDKKKLEIVKQVEKMKSGQVVMMENIRFSPDEKKDTGTLSQELANLADLFVIDGFAVAHRGAASVSGIAKYLPTFAGLLLESEIKGLEKVTEKYKKPYVAVIGGAKTETKIPVIKALLKKADNILIGGGIFNTYLKAKGYKIGDSIFDKDLQGEVLKYCKSRKIIKPVDVVVGTFDGKSYRHVKLGKKPHQICKKGESILDCGPETIQLFAKYIKLAETIVWNGALGVFEQKPYDIGTLSIARLVASRSKGKAYGVIGGGETLQTMDMVGMSEYVDLISTGGGAMLEFLSGKELPGIKAVFR